MHRFSATALALVGTILPITPAFAQTATVPIFFPGTDSTNLTGSIVSVDPKGQTISLFASCATDPVHSTATDCGLGPGLGVQVISKSIFKASISDSDFTDSIDCTVQTEKSVIQCTESVGGKEANDPGVTTSTYTGADILSGMIPVTITAGMEKLSATAAAGTASGSASGAKATQAGSVAASGPSATGSGAAAAHTGAASIVGPMSGMVAVGGLALLGLW